ncbi:helix-turn-helix domain-containing protein [Nocardia sp. NPDC050413]|uniref:helix-turn-helix domain-containing protein n=1 Tax=Nocardia sp. NPDC050413 TaxID=3155784 RepID=UPI0033E7387D
MVRHTSFRYRLDPTVEQSVVLARHAGAARFAFNRSLAAVKEALALRKTDPEHRVPWSGFDLINDFNAWKKTEDAGRVVAVDSGGTAQIVVTGLVWRNQLCQQVFEEAAVDCGRALAAFTDSRRGKRAGRRVGFPRFKKKHKTTPSFRIRNKHSKNGRAAIRVGDNETSFGDVAGDRCDQGPGRYPTLAVHAREGAGKDPVCLGHLSGPAVVDQLDVRSE